jgi:hypothetical protein
MLRALTAAAALLALAGCGGGDPAPERPQQQPMDRGVAGPDGAAGRVAVPASDDTPPWAGITLGAAGGTPLARATQPPAGQHPQPVQLTEPRLRGTAAGHDRDSGVARVRVSISERIACRHRDGRREERVRTRYYPPPQIERIRSNPGARLPTKLARTLPLALAGNRCGRAEPVAVHGQLWGEAINGSGLEAVTPHLRFTWRRITQTP